MSWQRVAPFGVLVAGVILLVIGVVRSTGKTHGISMGAHDMSVTTHHALGLQFWAGAGVILIGVGLLLAPRWMSHRAS